MVSSPQIVVRSPIESLAAWSLQESIPARVLAGEVYAGVSFPAPLEHVTNRVGTSTMELSPIPITTTWETLLVVVVILLIGSLIAIRLTEALSDRTLAVAKLPRLTNQTDIADDSDNHARSYERILSPETPSELLSDEGRVVRLLVENDGRIRQDRIVKETGWSKSKVSRTLSKMHDDETIEKVSLGRENVITLSDERTDGDGPPVDVNNPIL